MHRRCVHSASVQTHGSAFDSVTCGLIEIVFNDIDRNNLNTTPRACCNARGLRNSRGSFALCCCALEVRKSQHLNLKSLKISTFIFQMPFKFSNLAKAECVSVHGKDPSVALRSERGEKMKTKAAEWSRRQKCWPSSGLAANRGQTESC